MSNLSYYDILGVKSDAPVEDIKKAYQRAARANHPDSGGPGAGALFPLVQEAWETLRNESKRSEYDRKVAPPRPQQRREEPPTTAPIRNSAFPNVDAERARAQRLREAQNGPVNPHQGFGPGAPTDSFYAQPPEDETSIQDRIKEAPRRTLVMVGVSAFLWLMWAAICAWLIYGIGKDGVIFAFLSFFLTLGMTFLLVKFSRSLSAVYAFIFASITLPLPVAGLVTVGFSSTSWIFVVTLVGMIAAFGDHFLRRPVFNQIFESSRNS